MHTTEGHSAPGTRCAPGTLGGGTGTPGWTPLQLRLARFARTHPDVTVYPPTVAHARWRAEITPGAVPGDDRAMIITDPDLAAFMDRLEGLFRRDSSPRVRPG